MRRGWLTPKRKCFQFMLETRKVHVLSCRCWQMSSVYYDCDPVHAAVGHGLGKNAVLWCRLLPSAPPRGAPWFCVVQKARVSCALTGFPIHSPLPCWSCWKDYSRDIVLVEGFPYNDHIVMFTGFFNVFIVVVSFSVLEACNIFNFLINFNSNCNILLKGTTWYSLCQKCR